MPGDPGATGPAGATGATGEPGATGPTGATGPGAVTSSPSFTLTDASFVNTGSGYPLYLGGGATGFWPARVAVRTTPEITAEVVDSGAVLVYRKLFGSSWQLLPYSSGPNGATGDPKIYNVVALASPGTLTFYYYVTGTDFNGAANAMSRPVATSDYRYVVMTGSQSQAARAQHVNVRDLAALERFLTTPAGR